MICPTCNEKTDDLGECFLCWLLVDEDVKGEPIEFVDGYTKQMEDEDEAADIPFIRY